MDSGEVSAFFRLSFGRRFFIMAGDILCERRDPYRSRCLETGLAAWDSIIVQKMG